jgi:hypothetical protein
LSRRAGKFPPTLPGIKEKADPPLSALGPSWCQIWCQNQAIFPVFPDFAGPFAVNNLAIFQFHGMEEVVGSIPTRSTILSTT